MNARAIVLLLLCLGSAPALAHKLAPSLLQIDELYAHHYAVLWRTPRLAAVAPEPVFPDNCQRSEPALHSAGSALEWRWEMRCPGGLGGQTLAVTSLSSGRTAALLRLQPEGGRLQQQLLSADQPSYTVPRQASGWSLIGQYLLLGAEHILIGVDHLLFVTGLLLLARHWRQLLVTVTAFTVGHSLTLALVSLELIPRWPALVELGIAASILILALELSRRDETPAAAQARLPRLRSVGAWPLAAAFGLVHGLGFAGVLAELGLPTNDLVPALLAFNIGIEVGQLLFVAVLALLLMLARRVGESAHLALRWSAIYGMGGMAVFWCLERGAGLLGELVAM